jgi:hypothetical protein
MTKSEPDCGNATTADFVSVCCFCGERKSEAFGVCCECGLAPKKNDDLILSALLTSVFTDAEQLNSIGKGIAKGNYPGMSHGVREFFREALENEGMLLSNESN